MNLKEFEEFLDELLNSGWYAPPYQYYGVKPEVFTMLSAKRWAVLELKEFSRKKIGIAPVYIVEEFRQEMDKYACIAKDETAKFMFSTAYDVVTDILDMLL